MTPNAFVRRCSITPKVPGVCLTWKSNIKISKTSFVESYLPQKQQVELSRVVWLSNRLAKTVVRTFSDDTINENLTKFH